MHRDASSESDWTLDDIPLSSTNTACARGREDLFYLATAASFVEIASDLYTDNLIQYYDGDGEVTDWLASTWKPEELRHGRVLRDYVGHVWPEFDWQRAYAGFLAEYGPRCTVDEFEPTRSLEMVARCVVETGTATFYQALSDHAGEPVLAGIAARIRNDEIGHYKYFYRFFRRYGETERPGRIRVLGALKRRVIEARNDDADCALRHAFAVRQPDDATHPDRFHALSSGLTRAIRSRYPLPMATKMLLRPLALPASVARLLEGPVARITARLIL